MWGHFWLSWGSSEVIFGHLGGRFGLLGWSWGALWGVLGAVGGIFGEVDGMFGRSTSPGEFLFLSCGDLKALLRPQEGAKTDPKTTKNQSKNRLKK